MRVSAVLTQTADSWVAHCEEVDRAGEGDTPEEAVTSLRAALEEYFGQAQAVAPPSETPREAIEIVITGGPRGAR